MSDLLYLKFILIYCWIFTITVVCKTVSSFFTFVSFCLIAWDAKWQCLGWQFGGIWWKFFASFSFKMCQFVISTIKRWNSLCGTAEIVVTYKVLCIIKFHQIYLLISGLLSQHIIQVKIITPNKMPGSFEIIVHRLV